jgi:GAF domain
LAIRTVTELEQLLDQLEKESAPISPDSLERVAKAIASIFHLKTDEVAILEILPPGRLLRFVLPDKLRAVGTIPLSSSSALAARTVRSRRAEVVNNFPGFRHATVFEAVPLGRRHDEPIQKIVSAPILNDNRVIGVVQLCRKGSSSTDAGPDFTAGDLAELKGLGNFLTRLLALKRAS